MSIIEILEASYNDLEPKFRENLMGQIMEEIKREMIAIHMGADGQEFPIPFRKAVAWLDVELTGNQLYKKRERYTNKMRNSPFYKLDVHFTQKNTTPEYRASETEKEASLKKEIYFSIRGLYQFSMSYNSPKASAVRAYFTHVLDKYHMMLIAENSKLHAENKELRKGENKTHSGIDIASQQFQEFSDRIFELNQKLAPMRARYLEEKAQGKVYFIHEAGENPAYFKIGYTTRSMEDRLAELQTGNMRELVVYRAVACDNPQKIEHMLHECCEADRVGGEWFRISRDRVDELIEKI